MGAGRAGAAARRRATPAPFERDHRARVDRALRWAGTPGETVWGPLLRGKFGERADDIAMVWLWSKLRLRPRARRRAEEQLGYPRRSWEPLFDALRERDRGRRRARADRPPGGARSRADGFDVTAGRARARSARGHDPRAFEPAGEPERYDAVLATVPNDVFEQLLEPGAAARGLPRAAARRSSTTPRSACCSSSTGSSRPSTGPTSPTDALPFVGLIEHTNFVEPERYGGRRFLYVANYLAARRTSCSSSTPTRCSSATRPACARSTRRSTAPGSSSCWLHREPAAQPIVTVGYRERIPPLQTPVRGLVLANTTQIFPRTAGTNYAVRVGDEAARAMLEWLPYG